MDKYIKKFGEFVNEGKSKGEIARNILDSGVELGIRGKKSFGDERIDNMKCPKCGSKDIEKYDLSKVSPSMTGSTLRHISFECNNCGNVWGGKFDSPEEDVDESEEYGHKYSISLNNVRDKNILWFKPAKNFGDSGFEVMYGESGKPFLFCKSKKWGDTLHYFLYELGKDLKIGEMVVDVESKKEITKYLKNN